MILVVGLTPAWQRIYELDRLEIGEVNRARAVAQCASGKALNLAVALRLLNAEFRVISCVGGPVKKLIDDEFDALGIDRRWIETRTPTRVCTTVLDRRGGSVTELVENAAGLSALELESVRDVFAAEIGKADLLVMTGSLPIGAPPTFYAELLELAKCPAILDIRGPELRSALERRPLLIKPNREELVATVGRPLPAVADVASALRELADRGAQWTIVTDGGGPGWIFGHGTSWEFQPPRLERVVNPIGCGDALTAGIAVGIHQGQTPLVGLRLGLAVAAESATHLLPARFDPGKIDDRLATILPPVSVDPF